MAVRSLKQILSALGSTYNPQISNVRSQQALIPQEVEGDIGQIRAQEKLGYDNILSGARRRGLGFAGIPLGEQAQYSATEIVPAIARAQATGRQRALSLEDALLGVYERRNNQAMTLQQGDYDRDYQNRQAREQRRQFDLQLQEQRRARAAAAAQASAVPSLGNLFGGGGATGPRMVQQSPGSFAFLDKAGQPITAARYAKATGSQLGKVLYSMGRAGDVGAQKAYNEILALGKSATPFGKQIDKKTGLPNYISKNAYLQNTYGHILGF